MGDLVSRGGNKRKRAGGAHDGAIEIVQMTNAEPQFYPLIGPFLARRAIVKEMGGYPLWDDDAMTWFVALRRDDQQVRGFAALRVQRGVYWLDNTYVLPQWRGQGIYRRLLAERLAACPLGATLRAVCTSKSVDALLRRGFTVRRQRGQWTEVEMTKADVKSDAPAGAGSAR